MNAASPLSSTERQDFIMERIRRDRRVLVTEIRESLSVSEATVRRDLGELASRGLLRRVHGGAISIQRAAPELPILERHREQAEEKARIGRSAASLVEDGDTIFLGSGTTVLEVARELRRRQRLTVITNSLPVVNLFCDLPHIATVVVGGMLRNSELSFIGHISEQALAEVRADKVILGVRGLSVEHGLTNDYLPETLTDRAIQRMGGHVIIVADHTKCGTVSTAFLAGIDSIETLVTDRQTDAEFVAALTRLGIQVISA